MPEGNRRRNSRLQPRRGKEAGWKAIFAEPLNIGSSELVSINQLIDIVEEIAGVRLKSKYILFGAWNSMHALALRPEDEPQGEHGNVRE